MADLLDGVPLPAGVDPDAVVTASAAVREYCDWHIAPSITETVLVDVNPGGVLFLPSLYVTSVTSVDGATDGFTWTTTGKVTLQYGYRHYYNHWRPPVTVVFTHGYSECPATVVAAVVQLAARGVVPQPQVKSDTTGPFGVTYFAPQQPLDTISAYRRVWVA
jgi:hypothetical protein